MSPYVPMPAALYCTGPASLEACVLRKEFFSPSHSLCGYVTVAGEGSGSNSAMALILLPCPKLPVGFLFQDSSVKGRRSKFLMQPSVDQFLALIKHFGTW